MPITRDYKGRFAHGLIDSLDQQLQEKGTEAGQSRLLALDILRNNGLVDARGNLTPLGQHRERLGREERRKERAARQLGYEARHMGYDRKTGKAYVK